MTKEKETEILKETAHVLGCDSYCGQWLANILPHLVSCMQADVLPEVYFSEARYESEARAKQLAITQAATQFAERVMSQAEIDAETLRREAREEIARERAAVNSAYESMLAQAHAMVRNLEHI